MRLLLPIVLALSATASAQFQFFDQMFNGQQQQQEPQNVASDSNWYKQVYEQGKIASCFSRYSQSLGECRANMSAAAHCSNYLCPGTLSCVHFPHHCPCAFPEMEDKIELGDGSMLCASKGGFVAGELARKVELARKALL